MGCGLSSSLLSLPTITPECPQDPIPGQPPPVQQKVPARQQQLWAEGVSRSQSLPGGAGGGAPTDQWGGSTTSSFPPPPNNSLLEGIGGFLIGPQQERWSRWEALDAAPCLPTLRWEAGKAQRRLLKRRRPSSSPNSASTCCVTSGKLLTLSEPVSSP